MRGAAWRCLLLAGVLAACEASDPGAAPEREAPAGSSGTSEDTPQLGGQSGSDGTGGGYSQCDFTDELDYETAAGERLRRVRSSLEQSLAENFPVPLVWICSRAQATDLTVRFVRWVDPILVDVNDPGCYQMNAIVAVSSSDGLIDAELEVGVNDSSFEGDFPANAELTKVLPRLVSSPSAPPGGDPAPTSSAPPGDPARILIHIYFQDEITGEVRIGPPNDAPLSIQGPQIGDLGSAAAMPGTWCWEEAVAANAAAAAAEAAAR